LAYGVNRRPWSNGRGVRLLKIVGSNPTGGDLSAGAMALVLFELDTFLACLASELLRGRAGQHRSVTAGDF